MWLKLLVVVAISCIHAVEFMNYTEIRLNSLIPAKIINNYLIKYFESRNIFVSLSHVSTNHEQIHFQKCILTDLLGQSMNSQISFALDQIPVRKKNRIRFNVILVDSFHSFS